jgi:hypothetical protein
LAGFECTLDASPDTQRSLAPGELTFVDLVRKTRGEGRESAAARRRLYSGLAVAALPLVLGIVAFGVADPRLNGGIKLVQAFWILMFYAAALRSSAGSVSTPPSVAGLVAVNAVFLIGGLLMTWLRARAFDGGAGGSRFGIPSRL